MELKKFVSGEHKIITINNQEKGKTVLLCFHAAGNEDKKAGYYVLAECEGSALKWKYLVKENSVRKLKSERLKDIINEQVIDDLDAESIIFYADETSTKDN